MRKTAMAFLFCLAGSIVHAQEMLELNKPLKCGKAEWVLNYFKESYGETPKWVGQDNSSPSYTTYIVLLSNQEKRTWTLVQYDANLACVLGAGQSASEV
jgi:hypothetical protein